MSQLLSWEVGGTSFCPQLLQFVPTMSEGAALFGTSTIPESLTLSSREPKFTSQHLAEPRPSYFKTSSVLCVQSHPLTSTSWPQPLLPPSLHGAPPQGQRFLMNEPGQISQWSSDVPQRKQCVASGIRDPPSFSICSQSSLILDQEMPGPKFEPQYCLATQHHPSRTWRPPSTIGQH